MEPWDNLKEINEPRYEKTVFFSYAKTKTQISCAVTAQLISAFVLAIRIVQSIYFLNPKFQASSHLLWLYSLVCARPGRKPRRPVFSERGSNVNQNLITHKTWLRGYKMFFSCSTQLKFYLLINIKLAKTNENLHFKLISMSIIYSASKC